MFYKTYRLLAVNIFLVSLVVIAYFFGYIRPLFTNDVTHLTYLLAFIMSTNIGFRIWATYKDERDFPLTKTWSEKYLQYISSQLLYIGILGTVLGFGHIMLALQDLTDTSKVLTEMISGSLTLFNTTAIGIVSYLWTRLNNFLAEDE